MDSNSPSSRISAEARKRYEEVRQQREQIRSRQEQILEQTSADVRKRVEKMRKTRESIVTSEPPATVRPRVQPPADAAAQWVPASRVRFDFDARRLAWEQQRREQAEKRRLEVEQRVQPYKELSRQIAEKRRLAREDRENDTTA